MWRLRRGKDGPHPPLHLSPSVMIPASLTMAPEGGSNTGLPSAPSASSTVPEMPSTGHATPSSASPALASPSSLSAEDASASDEAGFSGCQVLWARVKMEARSNLTRGRGKRVVDSGLIRFVFSHAYQPESIHVVLQHPVPEAVNDELTDLRALKKKRHSEGLGITKCGSTLQDTSTFCPSPLPRA